MDDNKLAAEEARRVGQHGAVKSYVEREVGAEVAAEASIPTATDLGRDHLHGVTVAGAPGRRRRGGGPGADRAGAGRGCRRRRDPSRPSTAGHHGRGPSTVHRHDATPFINLCGVGVIVTPSGRSASRPPVDHRPSE